VEDSRTRADEPMCPMATEGSPRFDDHGKWMRCLPN
jgi:hypothetical protein